MLAKRKLIPKKVFISLLAVVCIFSLSSVVALGMHGTLPVVEQRTSPSVVAEGDVADLSVLLSSNYPCWWVGLAEYQSVPYRKIGPEPWQSNLTIIDEHVGSHFDAPSHFIPPPESGLPHATYYGTVTSDEVPVWQFVGEACVIDVSKILDKADNGESPIITKEMVHMWESQHRELGPGDVVLFRSGYDDEYYKPFPEGRRLLAEPMEGKAPAFPAPDAECIEYIVTKGVRTIGIDSPSMGPFPGAPETHWAGLGTGAIYVEQLINLEKLPNTGAFFVFLPVKLEGGSGAFGRAAAITEPSLAADLINSVKNRDIIDLSLTISPDLPCVWPGAGKGNYSYLYLVAPFNDWAGKAGPFYTRVHIFDEHTGTHFDPPTHFLPELGFDPSNYSEFVQEVLADYESKYGPRGFSNVYAADYPVHQMMGPARVIDVTYLTGTTSPDQWPASPAITVDDIKAYEEQYGSIEAGDVVLFKSNWSDKFYKRAPYDTGVAEALNGIMEGWPAPTPDALIYLAQKGVKAVGTDGASLGAVTGKEAIQTHWAGLTQGMCYVEFLTNLGELPPKGAFFIFLPLKEEGVPGGLGSAVALLP